MSELPYSVTRIIEQAMDNPPLYALVGPDPSRNYTAAAPKMFKRLPLRFGTIIPWGEVRRHLHEFIASKLEAPPKEGLPKKQIKRRFPVFAWNKKQLAIVSCMNDEIDVEVVEICPQNSQLMNSCINSS